ncbi:NAD(P)/FAD-dependent oxidoreductase [Pseudogemmobacter humi]|uniref:D-amino acid dehydrogenase small subunit n=1 Tax=Pseudogemmobacter humi TaxID=2483812 RepID=A0A3P5XAR0_9RHOB|nr:FAD-dependent oxidoreductase [Pseudogemmobacter humi]VDC28369.1 D-amino acid dehydrogenase small subunit [Pseudogemmobacter humi]
MKRLSTEIAVIGAGVIGLTIAERLLAEGREVTLIDPEPPGMGASYGNAGTIADYAVAPVGTPDVLKNLPSLLFNRNSPLAIRRAALPALMPWLLRFARQSLPGAAARNAAHIAALLADAGPMWLDLAQRAGADGIVQPRGCLYIYRHPAQVAAAQREMEGRRALGVSVEVIDGAQLAALEPGLPPHAGAAFFPEAIFLNDPGLMMQAIAAQVTPRAQLLPGRIGRLARQVSGVTLDGRMSDGTALHLHARRVVIAAGAHSRALAQQAGDRIPLDTERGYHAEWDMETPPLTRPSCVTERGFYLCPMAGRLRVAGTVELGGLTLPPSAHRIAKLVEGARTVYPDLPEPDRTWMGFRPSIPDSLPVIGPSRGGPEVLHAYGHGHIGVTLAPVTARLIADLIAGRDPGPQIAATLPSRF